MAQFATEAEMQLVESANKLNAGDENLRVKFHMGAVINEAKSQAEGRPIYDDKAFITIYIPGDKENINCRPAWDDANHVHSDTMRFRRQWEDFKAGLGDVESGTPLKEWPLVSRGQAEELVHFHIRSVEALATASDANLQKFQGGYALRQKAQDYLAKAKDNAPMEKLRSELEVRDNQLAALKAQQAEMLAALSELKKGNSNHQGNPQRK